MSALAELAAEADVIAGLGHNRPPEPEQTPYDAVKAHIDDLITEAKNWADGAGVETQAQANEISRLVEDFRLAVAAADKARVDEKRPLDDKIAEIQARYNALIADNKSQTGSAVRALAALKATLKIFLDAQEAERQRVADEARREAERIAAVAAAAIRAADATDLQAREDAEVLVTEAKQAEHLAAQVERDRPRAYGGARAMGLRKTYTAQIANPRETLLHYWGTTTEGPGRAALIEALQHLAQQDVNRKVHTIPGVTVVEGTRL